MRVLHICSGKLYGGVETLQVTLARQRALCQSMHPEYAVCFEGRLAKELDSSGAPVHRLGQVRVRNPISIWRARAALWELLAGARFDVAVCHSSWTQAIFGPVVRKAGLPLVFWLHVQPSPKHWLERWAQKTRPDSLICCSEFVARWSPNLFSGVPKQVIYYPVQPSNKGSEESRLAKRRELHTPAEAVVILQVSRLERWKGHELHLEALAALADLPDWVCWIAGGAQQRKEKKYFTRLKAIAALTGIANRVHFLGQRCDVDALLNAADIFCQPNSGPEPFGIVFVEALSAGLPVVTTAMGGGLEIVDSKCGVLVRPGDPPVLAAALKSLVTNPRMRSRMSAAGPGRAHELCDPATQLAQLAKVFERVVERRRAA